VIGHVYKGIDIVSISVPFRLQDYETVPSVFYLKQILFACKTVMKMGGAKI
jgi:hypothetical protein